MVHTTFTSNVSAPGVDAEQVVPPAGQATSCAWPVPTSVTLKNRAFCPLEKVMTSVVAGLATCTSLLKAAQSCPLAITRLSVTSSPLWSWIVLPASRSVAKWRVLRLTCTTEQPSSTSPAAQAATEMTARGRPRLAGLMAQGEQEASGQDHEQHDARPPGREGHDQRVERQQAEAPPDHASVRA